jgi:hypothetical protein
LKFPDEYWQRHYDTDAVPAIETPGGAGAANADVEYLGNPYVNANGIAGYMTIDEMAEFQGQEERMELLDRHMMHTMCILKLRKLHLLYLHMIK